MKLMTGTERASPAIWWLRRDLRLNHNQSLQASLSASSQVIPVFILDPMLIDSPYTSPRRLEFMLGGLRQMDKELRQRGSYLLVRKGDPKAVLTGLLAETGAGAIFAERDHSPYARRRDSGVEATLPLKLIASPAILPPGEVLKADGTAYTVFTPFLKAWKSRLEAFRSQFSAPPTPLAQNMNTPAGLLGESLPSLDFLGKQTTFPAGEAEARRRLQAFINGANAPVYGYAQTRDRLDLNATSMLSPYLRFGMLSARQVLSAAFSALERAAHPDAIAGAESWITELAWRDFYIHILHHFPEVRKRNFRPMQIRWINDPESFNAWSQGQTGYPFVDAAMRQLIQTGWMHNRARMVVASFLTKHLLVDWRWGERWFMQHLLDGDPAANNGGWQWSAGTGTDAAPYFRIFNPILQSARFDPQGEYIRRWLPELAKVPGKYIHAPWEMPSEIQRQSSCFIGSDYPAPIVEHAWARQRALAVYAAGKIR